MKITGTAIKLGAFSLVLLLFTAIIIVVFGQMRFDRTTGYSAIFSNASGLRSGQFVRASGVEVGKVSDVELIDGGPAVRVDFSVDRSLPLVPGHHRLDPLPEPDRRPLPRTQARRQTTSGCRAGGTIPIERTEPALDLDALIGGFRPLFRALDPDKVNNIAQIAHHGVPGPGRHHQRHPGPDRAADLHAGRPRPGHRRGDHATSTPCWTPPCAHQKQLDDDRQELRGADHRAEEPRRPDRRGRRRTSATRRARSRTCLPTTARCCKNTLGNSRPSSSRSIDQKDELNDLLTQAADGAEDHRPRRWYLRRLLQLLRL